MSQNEIRDWLLEELQRRREEHFLNWGAHFREQHEGVMRFIHDMKQFQGEIESFDDLQIWLMDLTLPISDDGFDEIALEIEDAILEGGGEVP